MTGLHQVPRMPHPLRPRHLGNMNEPLDARFDFDEGAEVHDLGYRAADAIPFPQALAYRVPRIGGELFDPQRKARLRSGSASLDLKNLDIHLLAGRDEALGI